MIITGAGDVKTYLDNFECGPGINWSNPFDSHDTLIFQVILGISTFSCLEENPNNTLV